MSRLTRHVIGVLAAATVAAEMLPIVRWNIQKVAALAGEFSHLSQDQVL
jgi:hypothetical protein